MDVEKYTVFKKLSQDQGGSGYDGRTDVFAVDSQQAIELVKEHDEKVFVAALGNEIASRIICNTIYFT